MRRARLREPRTLEAPARVLADELGGREIKKRCKMLAAKLFSPHGAVAQIVHALGADGNVAAPHTVSRTPEILREAA